MKKFLKFVASLLIGIAIGTAATYFYFSNKNNQVTQIKKETTTTNENVVSLAATEDVPKIRVGLNQAINKFTRLYSSANISEVNLKIQGENYIYDISGFDAKKDCSIQIDASNDLIIGQSTLRHDYEYNETDPVKLDFNKIISRNEASQIAIQKVGGGEAREWLLKTQKDKSIWMVTVIDKNEIYKITINALTKEIID